MGGGGRFEVDVVGGLWVTGWLEVGWLVNCRR